MSKKPLSLSFTDIVLGAEAETIRQALEARTEIDRLLEERAKAYQQIAQLESQVEDLLGDEASFPFPEPPEPVFGYGPSKGAKKARKKTVAVKTVPTQSAAPDPAAPSDKPASEKKKSDG